MVGATEPWLCGAWERRYIRQGQPLSAAAIDDSVVVRYIQTPWGFVDVRVSAERPAWPLGGAALSSPTAAAAALSAQGFGKPGWAGMMAFAGVTVVREADYGGIEVHWEEALNLWPPRASGWDDIDAGLPLAPGGAQALLLEREEYNPDGSGGVVMWHERPHPGSAGMPYLEEWRRLDADGGGFFCARCGDSLLVVAGDWFGYAEDGRDRAALLRDLDAEEKYDSPGAVGRLAASLCGGFADGSAVVYCAGRRSTGWMVDVSAAGGGEGQRLEVCSAGGWRAITTDGADGAGTSQGQQAQQGSERLDDLLTGAEFIRKELGSTGLPRVRGAAGSAAL